VRRLLFERKTTAKLHISQLSSSFKSSFSVNCLSGHVTGGPLVDLEVIHRDDERSKMISFAHMVLQGQSGEIVVLNGSLENCRYNLSLGQDEDYLKLTRVSKSRDDQTGSAIVDVKLPMKQVVRLLQMGGELTDENGLIYATRLSSATDVTLISTGYEYENSAPTFNFFTFDLRKVEIVETGELVEVPPLIEAPVRQSFVTDFPLLAYKSFMSDDSEIVLVNMARK